MKPVFSLKASSEEKTLGRFVCAYKRGDSYSEAAARCHRTAIRV